MVDGVAGTLEEGGAVGGKRWLCYGLVSYVLLIDHNSQDKRLSGALNWLKSHQNREYGYWTASSMNKDYPANSMMVKFMQDAATGFAAMALLEAERR